MEGHAVDFHQEGNRCSSHIALVVQIVQEAPQHLGGSRYRKEFMDAIKDVFALCRGNSIVIMRVWLVICWSTMHKHNA